MTAPTPDRLIRRLALIASWIIPLATYVALILPIGWRQRFQINPDGIIYLRKAQMLLAGHAMESISGYWPPGLSWCLALVLKLRPQTDGINAIHFLLGCWGGLWVVASVAFLYTIAPRQAGARLIGGIAVALAAVHIAIIWMAPDLLLCGCLLGYLCCWTWPTQRPWMPFLGGVLAGVGYLCKAYGLPFFLLHSVATIAYRQWVDRSSLLALGMTWKRTWQPLILGFCGLLLFVAPWAGALSYKYGKFTLSMVYHHNHLNVAPGWWLRSTPDFCMTPPSQYLCIWEGLDPGPRIDWSMWESAALFRHQLGVVIAHVGEIIEEVWTFDRIGLVLFTAILALLPARWAWQRSRDPRSLWILLTAAIYCSGFLVVAFETRYVVPFLLPLGIALCFREAERWQLRWGAAAAGGVFLVVGGYVLLPYLAYDGPRPIFARVADVMKAQHLQGLFTSSENNNGVNVAYYLNSQIVLLPAQADFKGRDDITVIDRKLQAARVSYLLLWTDSRTATTNTFPKELATALHKTHHWEIVSKLRLDSVREVYFYHRVSTSTLNGDDATS